MSEASMDFVNIRQNIDELTARRNRLQKELQEMDQRIDTLRSEMSRLAARLHAGALR